MTEIGKLFAQTADRIVNRYDGGFGSKKMSQEFVLYKGNNYVLDSYYQAKYEQYEQLVKMGYLRKFVTDEIYAKTTSHHHVGHWEKRICYGLTPKGWEVAPQYLKALKRDSLIEELHNDARILVEKTKKSSQPITFEEALELAKVWTKYQDIA